MAGQKIAAPKSDIMTPTRSYADEIKTFGENGLPKDKDEKQIRAVNYPTGRAKAPQSVRV